MGNQVGSTEIKAFLEEVKTLLSAGKYDFVPRRKNMESLAQYGLTIKDARDEILELRVSDYYKGPKQDFERNGVIWEFKKSIDETPFYIKIKIVQEDGENILKCLGFHKDDFA